MDLDLVVKPEVVNALLTDELDSNGKLIKRMLTIPYKPDMLDKALRITDAAGNVALHATARAGNLISAEKSYEVDVSNYGDLSGMKYELLIVRSRTLLQSGVVEKK